MYEQNYVQYMSPIETDLIDSSVFPVYLASTMMCVRITCTEHLFLHTSHEQRMVCSCILYIFRVALYQSCKNPVQLWFVCTPLLLPLPASLKSYINQQGTALQRAEAAHTSHLV